MRFKTLAAVVAALGAVALAPSVASAQAPTQQCVFNPYKICWNDGNAPITRSASNSLGSGKQLTTTPTLYRDGSLWVDSFGQNSNWFYGTRPKQFVVVLDNMGRQIWVTRVFENATLCGVMDPSCASSRRETFFQSLPAVVAQYATDLRIYASDSPSFINMRESVKIAIQYANDIAPVIKAIVALM